MTGFKIYNATIVVITCFVVAWRRPTLGSFLLMFPLLVMADSELSCWSSMWYTYGARWPLWRTIFKQAITYDILVSVVLTATCVALWRKWPEGGGAGRSASTEGASQNSEDGNTA